ncbi:unnamed protein product [Bathycoccus prasinos]|jgi:hypothetical protein
MSTSHVSSWSRLLHDERDPEIVLKEQRNAPASISSDDDDSDDQPRLASPETFFATSQQGRPSTSSRALKTFGRANNNHHQAPRSTDDESVVVPEKPLVLLGRLKTRTTGKKKKKKTKVLKNEKCSEEEEEEEEENFKLRAIVIRSPEPHLKKKDLKYAKASNDEVHAKVRDGSALCRRAKEREEKKTFRNDIALVAEEKLEHLLRICREAPDGENWRDKVNALERLSEISHAYSISRSSSMFIRAIEDGGKHAQDLRACLAKAALKFLRAVCEHCDAPHCVSNSSNALTVLGKCMLKRASDGSAFLKQDALDALRLLRERIGPNAFLKIILAQPSNVNPRVRRTMALCLSEVSGKERKIDRQTIKRVLLVKDVMVKDGDAETRAYARKIFSSSGKNV